MWPGMRPATGWMAKRTSAPLRFEHSASSLHGVLGLRHGHAVAGDDDHALRGFEHVVGVLGGDGFHFALAPRRPALHRLAPNPPKSTLPMVRFIALHMMMVRMMPEVPTRQPATMSTLFRMTKPAADAGEAGEAIEQGDDHRHVAAADGHDQRRRGPAKGSEHDAGDERDIAVADA